MMQEQPITIVREIAPIAIDGLAATALAADPLGAGIALASVVAGCAIALAVAARWLRTPPLDRAFGVLAYRLRLRRRERAVLAALAERAHAAPVALLVSEHAFRRAAALHARPGRGARVLDHIARKAFA